MRKPALLLATLLGGLAIAAQQHFDFVDPKGNVEIHGTSGKVTFDGGPTKKTPLTYRFDVRSVGSKVRAIVHDQGLEFFADRVQGEVSSEKDKGLRNATASGGIRVVKTASGNRAEMTGSVAKYTKDGASGNLELSGPVRLTNNTSAKGQSLIATGKSAIASLASGSTARNPLRTATLRGPVMIDAFQRVSGNELSAIHATGSRLDIDNTSNPAKLTLSGGVHVTGKAFGNFSGNKLVMTLNDQGEVLSISGGA